MDCRDRNGLLRLVFLSEVWLFLFLFLIARGLLKSESFDIVLAISVQTYIGAQIWNALSIKRKYSMAEALAIGFALGSAFFTIFDQILVSLGYQSNNFLIPLAIATVLIVFDIAKSAVSRVDVDQDDFYSLLICSACVIAGFGELTNGSLISTVIVLITFVVLRVYKPSIVVTCIASIASIGTALLLVALYRPPVLYNSWFLRPLFTQTDDAVFSESVAYSISHFGMSNYAASSGVELRYHWFSLAWSGFVERTTEIRPFGMTLHVVPVISFFVLAMLLISIAKAINVRSNFLFIAPLVLFFAMSAPYYFYFYFVINTSNLLSLIWVLLSFLVFIHSFNGRIRFGSILLGLLFGVVLLSKIPFLVALITGFLSSFTYVYATNKSQRKLMFAQLSTICLTSFLVFFLFLAPHGWENRSYILDWNLLNIAFGSRFRGIIAFSFLLILMISRFSLFFRFQRADPRMVFKLFIIGASVSGFIRFIVSGSSSEEYFLNNALLFGSIGVGLALDDLAPLNFHRHNWRIFFLLPLSGFLCFLTIEIWSRTGFRIGPWWQFNLPLLVPFVIALSLCVIAVAIGRSSFQLNSVRVVIFLFIVCLIGANAGVFFGKTTKVAEYFPRGSIAADIDLESLSWLKTNSDSSDIVATNRFLCPGVEPCGYDESSFLISAVAHRQVLIEGPKFVAGGRPYPKWMTERILISRSFADSPSDYSYRQLLSHGVSWFYLDTQFLGEVGDIDLNTWNKWASIEYKNSNIIIFRLNTI